MSKGTILLDEALELARKEKNALENGEYDEAIELAQRRSDITGMAWNNYEPSEKDTYKSRLSELAKIQLSLTDFASRAHETIREKLSRSRQEKRRIRGYQMAVGQALQ